MKEKKTKSYDEVGTYNYGMMGWDQTIYNMATHVRIPSGRIYRATVIQRLHFQRRKYTIEAFRQQSHEAASSISKYT